MSGPTSALPRGQPSEQSNIAHLFGDREIESTTSALPRGQPSEQSNIAHLFGDREIESENDSHIGTAFRLPKHACLAIFFDPERLMHSVIGAPPC